MNSDYEIYQGKDHLIPVQDKARLEGYLYGKMQQEELNSLKKEIKENKNE